MGYKVSRGAIMLQDDGIGLCGECAAAHFSSDVEAVGCADDPYPPEQAVVLDVDGTLYDAAGMMPAMVPDLLAPRVMALVAKGHSLPPDRARGGPEQEYRGQYRQTLPHQRGFYWCFCSMTVLGRS